MPRGQSQINLSSISEGRTIKLYTLLDGNGNLYKSSIPGELGGHRRQKIYGRLDCSSAQRAIAKGGPYASLRVFFKDEQTAILAGYRPCARCMPVQYANYKRKIS